MSKKLLKYLKKEIDSGASPEQVKETLISAGWSKEEVEEAMEEFAENGMPEIELEEDVEPVKRDSKGGSDRPALFFFVLAVVLMAILILGLIIAFTPLIDPRMIF